MRILAHRGGTERAPENSLDAFRDAIDAGADVIETDVRLTADGIPVLIHDATIERLSDSAGVVREMTHRALREAGVAGPTGTPTLTDALRAFPDTRFNIDLKEDDHGLADAVSGVLREYDALHRVTIASFHADVLEYFRRENPAVETSTHPGEITALLLHAWFRRPAPVTTARITQVPYRHGVIPVATRRFIAAAHRLNISVDVWTVNDDSTIRRLMRRGADGIVTDRPRWARRVLTTLATRQ